MMSDQSADERRRAQRVEAALDLKLHIQAGGDDDFGSLDTLNVSSSGIYFRSENFIEPMTRLALDFDVETGVGESGQVRCEGIVARIQPEEPTEDIDDYEVAVFFTTIDAESLSHLESYIALKLQA